MSDDWSNLIFISRWGLRGSQHPGWPKPCDTTWCWSMPRRLPNTTCSFFGQSMAWGSWEHHEELLSFFRAANEGFCRNFVVARARCFCPWLSSASFFRCSLICILFYFFLLLWLKRSDWEHCPFIMLNFQYK